MSPPTAPSTVTRAGERPVTAALWAQLVVLGSVGSLVLWNLFALDEGAAARLEVLRAQELRVTLTEQLLGTTELTIAAGRGFLISGDERLRHDAETSRRRFAELLGSLSTAGTDDPRDDDLLEEIREAEARFADAQVLLFSERTQIRDTADLAERFEDNLLPQVRRLHVALDALESHMGRELAAAYGESNRYRTESVRWVVGTSLVMMLLAGVLMVWIARSVGRVFDREQESAERARRALALRQEILGVVAHDLRNPLNAIIMGATLMGRTADPAQLHDRAASVERIARRMAELVGNLLDAATAELGGLTVTPEDCSVRELAESTIAVAHPNADAAGVRLSASASGTDLRIRADRSRVLQVLSNLVGNAIKVSPEGGVVDVAAERDATPGWVRFCVSDAGPGIEGEKLTHLFDRFWHEGRAGGTGLGLFIAKSVVAAHGGRIWAESALGQGARFYFTMPEVAASAA